MLAPDEEGEAAHRVARAHVGERRSALARHELQRPFGDDGERGGRFPGAEGVRLAAHVTLLHRLGKHADAHLGELSQERAGPQRGVAIDLCAGDLDGHLMPR